MGLPKMKNKTDISKSNQPLMIAMSTPYISSLFLVGSDVSSLILLTSISVSSYHVLLVILHEQILRRSKMASESDFQQLLFDQESFMTMKSSSWLLNHKFTYHFQK